jgi:UDP-2,4-diacetamido-2,4,6-trideoxy-beta-L-altropyranose hydrolase
MGTNKGHYIIIRADASSHMGIGHLMRCLALAQGWQLKGGHAIILSRCESDEMCQRITDAGIEFIPIVNPHPDSRDLDSTLKVLRMRSAGTIGNPAWIVLDGYHFDPTYQQAVRMAGYHLLVIDDMAHLPIYHADILLNQNLGAEKLKYNCDLDTNLLLGSQYILIRKEFLAWRGWQRKIPKVARKVLVTMGGGDPDNVTLKVIHALEQLQVDGLEAVVVVGSSNPHYEILQSAIRNLQLKIRFERNASYMPELMAWADMAITAGGSTCWELAFMGVPALILVLADNQCMVASGLETAGISINLGRYANVTPDDIALRLSELAHSPNIRDEMTKRGRNLVDGNGTSRVIEWMQTRALNLRAAQEADCIMIYEWANDEVTRSVSFSTDPIPWEDHQTWYKAKLTDSNSLIYIALDPELSPVGMVRYQLEGTEAIVSINLASNQRGKGYGSKILRLASNRVFQDTKVSLIHAYIKPDNSPSIHAFTKAGFFEKGIVDFQGNQACHFILHEDLI